MSEYHVPALLNESIDALQINPAGVYVDATFGGGGHSQAILSQLTTGKLIAFDQDSDTLSHLPNQSQFIFAHHNFRYLKFFLNYLGINEIDGLLADLGVSSHHFDQADRGFSTRFDGPLDMRMNSQASLTAASIINSYEEVELARMFYIYGELDNSRKIASILVKSRKNQPIQQIEELKRVLAPIIPRQTENKFLAKVFQALRIEVNQELSALEDLLHQSETVLKPGGRLVILTYHSLEDRLVKNFLKSGNIEGKIEQDLYGNTRSSFTVISKKAIIPSAAEIEQNSRARSAKLRIGERNND